MEHLTMHSVDGVTQNVERIAALFPNCVTERKGEDGSVQRAIDFDMLRQELSRDIIDTGEERYQFTWPGKRDAIRLANSPIAATLRPVREDSVDFDNTQNLYIEGDNLDVLKLLRETYLGKVKMIYIDPPYNTGNDFVYEDDFSQTAGDYLANSGQYDEQGNRLVANTESNGRFHTDWLNMIYPRLKVARDLLSDDGVIFISIDDNEVENLRKICDEIFGSQNFVSQLTIIVKPEGRRYGAFAKTHEYALVFAKSLENSIFYEIEVEGSSYQYSDQKGGFNLKGLRNRNVKSFNSTNRPNLRYPFYVDINNPDSDGLCKVSTEYIDGFIKVMPSTIDGLESVWRWGKEKSTNEIDMLVAYKGNDGEIRIFQKERKLTQTPKTVWIDKHIISNKGTSEVETIVGKGVFSFPKPLRLIINMLSIGSSSDDIILDFFSGSATTAHAVMQLNAEDGGNRKFIMVQLPEVTDEKSEARKAGYANICEIGKERIRRAGKKIKAEHPEAKDLDIGFRVLRLDSSNMEDVYYTPDKFDEANLFNMVDNVKTDRTEEDLLFQVMLELDVPLSASIVVEQIAGKRVFNVSGGHLIATFDKDVNESTVTEIARRKPNFFVMRDASAANDNVLDNFEQIFRHYSPDTICKIL